MKKYLLGFGMLCMALAGMTSCSETEEEGFDAGAWKTQNETYFDKLMAEAKADPTNYKVIKAVSLPDEKEGSNADYIIAKVIYAAPVTEGDRCPMQTDSVSVHYRGQLIDGTTFDSSWNGGYDLQKMQPTKFTLASTSGNGLVEGFSTALQNMHAGDRWMVYMPSQLGYGTTTSKSIPANSVLIFDLTLQRFWSKK